MSRAKYIPPRDKLPFQEQPLRVVAYCRVSTGSEQQMQSMEAQMSYYRLLLEDDPHWKCAGVLGDVGSGLSNQKQSGFQKLLSPCRKRMVDLVLTKSISRFGRNFYETALVLRGFKSLGINVLFESEGFRLQDKKTYRYIEAFCAGHKVKANRQVRTLEWGYSAHSDVVHPSAIPCPAMATFGTNRMSWNQTRKQHP